MGKGEVCGSVIVSDLSKITTRWLHFSTPLFPFSPSLWIQRVGPPPPSPGFTVLSTYRAVCSPLVVMAGVRLLARSHLLLGPCQRFYTNSFPPLRRIPMPTECYKDNIKPAVKTMLWNHLNYYYNIMVQLTAVGHGLVERRIKSKLAAALFRFLI